MQIQRSSNLVLAACLLGLAIVSGGCFRSAMRHTKSCSDADPNCQLNTPGDAGWDGPHASGGLGDGSAGGTGGGLVDGRRDGGVGGAGGGPVDGRRDGALGGTGGGPVDGRRDGALDGRRDGPLGGAGDGPLDGRRDGALDGGRDGGLDRAPDLVGDVRRDTPGDRPSDVVCGTKEICGNGIDDDCNGFADCFDSACKNLPSCIDHKKEICNNGIDDDGNQLIDCKDPACFGDPSCFVPGHEICNNGLDDDDDGLVDCNDPDCLLDASCVVHPGKEICDNGIDDNGDKLVDCSDPQCKTFPACLSAACTADVDFGAIASSGASVTRTISTVGAVASYDNICVASGGVARVASFSLAATADLKLDFSQGKGLAHVVGVYRAGVGQACNVNQVYCLPVGQKPADSHTFNALAAGNYWIIVQSYTGTMGSTTVTLSTGKTTTPEICNNGIDDDGNGAIDCADLACANATNCHPCIPDINLGAIVVGDTPKSTVVDTSKGSNRYHPSCAGDSTGKDIVVRFTFKATAGLLLDITQTGDHAYGLYNMPAAGESCDDKDNQGGCSYLGGDRSLEASWWPLAAGEYLLIFKPIAAGKEGVINLTVSAFTDRGVEICDNGIDDDSNGLTDCDDPACTNTINCKAPMCLPDSDLGDIDVGTRKSLNVDLTSATRTFSTFCGRGDGHGRVYRLNLLQAMSLGVRCTQTGDQVMQIGAQVNPLDLCDANSVDCVDPAIQPFGCNFAIPSLQPGTYNLIVQAFASGTEGTMNLALTGIAETVLEICNNGIDDDGDGATDCFDRKCAGDPSCQKLVCHPDWPVGTLPLNGSITPGAVVTWGAGDDQTGSTCVSGKGGPDAVASFTLAAKADLTIEWAQSGNHALVLYQVVDPRLPCEANTAIDCKATAGALTGSYQLSGLAQGDYYLVVDADKSGSEGWVGLQISGLPSP
jgi:hypothetical protein